MADPFAGFQPAPDPWAGFEEVAPQSPIMGEQKSMGQGVVQGLKDLPEGAYGLLTGNQPEQVTQGGPGFNVGRAIGQGVVGAPFAYLMPGAASESLAPRILSGMASGGLTGALQPGGDVGSNALWGAVGGSIAPGATEAAGKIISPAISDAVSAMRGIGANPSVGQSMGGITNKIEQKLTSMPGIGDMIENARGRGAQSFNRGLINHVLDNIGEKLDPQTAIGRDAINEMQSKVGNFFDKVASNVTWQADPQFVPNITNIVQNANLLPDRAKQLGDLLKNQFGKANAQGIMPGNTFKEVDSKLGQEANDYLHVQDPDQRRYGDTVAQIQAEFRRAAAASNPAYAADLNKANAAYADMLRVSGAASAQGAKEGVFTAPQFSASVRRLDPTLRHSAFGAGNARMQDLAEAGQSVFGNTVPDSGTAGRAMMALATQAGLAGGAGAVGGETAMKLGLPIVGANALGMGLYSKPGQAALNALLSRRPGLAGPLASVVRKAAPFGSVGLGGLLSQQAQ